MLDLAPLFERAEADALWFVSTRYPYLWLASAELLEEQARGNFLWEACLWQLADPRARLDRLELEAHRAQSALNSFRARLARTSGEPAPM